MKNMKYYLVYDRFLYSGYGNFRIHNCKLIKKKYSVLVVDKAKGVGGRASNKKINKKISFDHGLQYFTARNNLFKNYLNNLIKKEF